MRKMMVVAVREYLAAVRTKAFLVSLIFMPILMGGSIIVQSLVKDKVDTRDKKFAFLDYTGQIFDAVADAAAKHNAEDIYKGEGPQRTQKLPRFVVEKIDPSDQEIKDASFALSERVRKKEIVAFVVIEPDVIEPPEEGGATAISYHSNSPTYTEFQRWVTGPINQRIQQIRIEKADLDPEVVANAVRPMPVGNLKLLTSDSAGNIIEAEKTDRMATIFVPMGMMMLMFMVVMVAASPLVQSVLEEKMQRIAEVLLGSIPPFQLMMGKLIGVVGVSLTIATVYLVGTYYAMHRAGYIQLFPTHVIWWFVLYLALAVLMYGSLFIAIGAAVTDLKESQSLMTPVMVVVVSPMFVWFQVLREPNAAFSVITSLIPPATPMLMIIRQTVPPGIPLWQPLLGILLVLITTLALVFASGRIFRIGILMQGRGAKPLEMLRWIFRG